MQIPDIHMHLLFIKEATWQFRDLESSEVEQSFKDAFERLPENEQKAISLEIQALGLEISVLDGQNEGVAIVRQDEIVNRLREILDSSGVVAIAKRNGVKRIRQEFAELAEKAAAYLQEYKSFAQSVKDKSNDIRENAKYLIAVISGIHAELGRLQLADINKIQPKGELAREKSARTLVLTTVGQLGQGLENSIELEGLIGFSTLCKLIKEFYSAKKYLEDAVLQAREKKT